MSEYDKRFDDAAKGWKDQEREEHGKVRDLDEAIGNEWVEYKIRGGRPLTLRGQELPENFLELSELEQYDILKAQDESAQTFEDRADKLQTT
jgi:hypothetical protein